MRAIISMQRIMTMPMIKIPGHHQSWPQEPLPFHHIIVLSSWFWRCLLVDDALTFQDDVAATRDTPELDAPIRPRRSDAGMPRSVGGRGLTDEDVVFVMGELAAVRQRGP